MKPLNPFDISLEGINLVEASAGTGKTYNITSLYVRALIEFEKKVSEILVVTYTEAATKELRDRLQKRIRESIEALKGGIAPEEDAFLQELKNHVEDRERAVDLLTKAVHSFDEASVYTIHGFCFHALQEQAFESGTIFDAELIGDDSEIVLDVIDDYWRAWVNEATNDPLKHPLLKLLTDKGYNPVSLTAELASFIGKPYLEVLPKNDPTGDVEKELRKLQSLFGDLKRTWELDREEIFRLLNEGHLSYYRSDWLEGWMSQMDEWLRGDTPPLQLFDKYDKFRQSFISSSLKKSSEKKGISPPAHPFFRLADEYAHTAEPLIQFDVSFKRDLLLHLHETLDRKKDELQVLSFDDLLLKLNKALSDPERGDRFSYLLRSKYPIALVDEFQDTDPVQYSVFRRIYAGTQKKGSALFMIGDPKQSIYSFRGADIFAYIQARRDADDDRVFNLNHNFRSVPELLQGVETVFGRHANPFLLEAIQFEPVKPGRDDYTRFTEDGIYPPPIQFRELHQPDEDLPMNKSDAEELAAADTAREIVSLIQKGKKGESFVGSEPVRAKNIAVLVRTHNQANIISKALQERNVKCVQYSQQSVFRSIEAEELEYVLRAVAEPVNEARIKSAMATRLMGYDAKELLDLEEDEQAWTEILAWFTNWHHAWQEHGFAFMFRRLLCDARIFCHMIEYEDGERMLTNVRHLAELIQEEEQENQRGARGLIRWLARRRREEERNLENEQLRLESDEELVKVVTMHRSKGLEYPIVFCPFLWHGSEYSDRGQPLVFHDEDDTSRTYLDLQGKNDPERAVKRLSAAKEDLAESVRLAYVALTRAEQRCYITWIQANKSECSPLGYLLLSPNQVFDVLRSIIKSEKSYKSLDPDVFSNAIEHMVETGDGSIELAEVHNIDELRKTKNGDESPVYLHRKFTRESDLEPEYSISSFSSLMRVQESSELETDYEQYLDETFAEPVKEDETDKEMNIYTFPRGPQPGTCIHKIFEEIDFEQLSSAPEVIDENLRLFGIDTAWSSVVQDMLHTVIDRPLLNVMPGLKLGTLQKRDIISELEFYYQITAIETHELYHIIRGGATNGEAGFVKRGKGFMKGFIDLTFTYQGRFFILDYKTNYLGDNRSDYQSAKLHEEMIHASYDLQYHIYSVALHRYLSRRLPEYSYDKHFGGVFYLFVRGMNDEGREGIYFKRPEKEVITTLDQYLKEGKRG